MKCIKCHRDCVGSLMEDPAKCVCIDCAMPALRKAADAASRAVEKGHFERTGECKSSGEILRGILGMNS
jgi:hypothetical protein